MQSLSQASKREVNIELNKDLIRAAISGSIEEVKEFLDRGADINYIGGEDNKSAIYYAFIKGHSDLVELLETKGANIKINISQKIQEKIQYAENRSDKILEIRNLNIVEIGELGLALKYNQVLNLLYLSYNNIGDEGAIRIVESLKCNQAITNLFLYNNQLGPKGVTRIAELLKYDKTITEINFDCNEIGDEGTIGIAEFLKENQILTRLSICDNNIGPKGIKRIAESLNENQALTSLHLDNNRVGSEGATRIAEALQCNQSLTVLDLSGNNIGDEGATRIAGFLKYNKTITEINLDSNKIGDAGAIKLLEALQSRNCRVNYLNLNTHYISLEIMSRIYSQLEINKAKEKSADLSSNNLARRSSRGAAESDEGILGKDLIVAAQNGDINQVARLLDEGAEIDYMGGEDNKSAIYYAFVKGHSDLVELLETKGANIKINISQKIQEKIKDAENRSYKDIENSEFDIVEIGELALALKDNQDILEIDLYDNNLGLEGATRIAESLKCNQAITSLDLGDNNIGDEGAKIIVESLKFNHAISELDLYDNNIGDEGIKSVAEALKDNQNITILNFSGNNIGDEGAKKIAKFLKHNQDIISLGLNYNNIGNEGAVELLEALQSRYCRVSSLSLEGNAISLEILSQIKRQLKINEDKEKSADFPLNSIAGSVDNVLDDVLEATLRLEKSELENQYKYRIAELESLSERSNEQEEELLKLKDEAAKREVKSPRAGAVANTIDETETQLSLKEETLRSTYTPPRSQMRSGLQAEEDNSQSNNLIEEEIGGGGNQIQEESFQNNENNKDKKKGDFLRRDI